MNEPSISKIAAATLNEVFHKAREVFNEWKEGEAAGLISAGIPLRRLSLQQHNITSGPKPCVQFLFCVDGKPVSFMLLVEHAPADGMEYQLEISNGTFVQPDVPPIPGVRT